MVTIPSEEKFDSVVLTKPTFQRVLKDIRKYVTPGGALKILRLVGGYDVTLNNVLILKGRVLPNGYFVRFSPGLFEREVIPIES